MKYFILEKENNLTELIDFLIDDTNLPQIHRRLNIYSAEDDTQIEILDNKVLFRESFRNKYISIKNKNLKQFFKYVQSKNSKGFIINDIVLLKFLKVDLLFNTFHGNILSTDDDVIFEKIKQKFDFETYDNINDHIPVFMEEPEFLFDEMGNVNSKIKSYANKTGLDIRSSSASLKIRLSNLSNDYSHIEQCYELITKEKLLSFNSSNKYVNKFKNISIIIPTFNQNVIPTLLSIQGQNISKEDKTKIQVVVIDDGSNVNVLNQINSMRNKLDYEINVISFDKNNGLSNARNVGIALAKYDLLLFIDSDIILSKDYIYDINIRLQLVPNAIFVAMRKNIENDSNLILEKNLLARCSIFFRI